MAPLCVLLEYAPLATTSSPSFKVNTVILYLSPFLDAISIFGFLAPSRGRTKYCFNVSSPIMIFFASSLPNKIFLAFPTTSGIISQTFESFENNNGVSVITSLLSLVSIFTTLCFALGLADISRTG